MRYPPSGKSTKFYLNEAQPHLAAARKEIWPASPLRPLRSRRSDFRDAAQTIAGPIALLAQARPDFRVRQIASSQGSEFWTGSTGVGTGSTAHGRGAKKEDGGSEEPLSSPSCGVLVRMTRSSPAKLMACLDHSGCACMLLTIPSPGRVREPPCHPEPLPILG